MTDESLKHLTDACAPASSSRSGSSSSWSPAPSSSRRKGPSASIWPIAAFVALGFEHSIANMYFIPMGIFLRSTPELAGLAEGSMSLEGLTWSGFASNLVPVTLGNIVGGTLLVAGVYWFAFLRHHRAAGTAEE